MPTARVKWTGNNQFVAESGSGHAIVLDAGTDDKPATTGPSPLELLLLGLAGCTGIDIEVILRRMRRDLVGLEVEVEADRADTHPRVYTRIRLTYRARGRGISEKDLLKAIRLSETTYCSASAMISKAAPIESRYELTDLDSGHTLSGVYAHDAADA